MKELRNLLENSESRSRSAESVKVTEFSPERNVCDGQIKTAALEESQKVSDT